MSKNNKRKKVLYYGILPALALMALAGGTVYAAGNDQVTNVFRGKGSHLNSADREAFQKDMETKRTAELTAINNNDYKAWVEAVGTNCPLLSKVNADNFSQFAAARKQMEAGRQALEAMGINEMGQGMGMGRGR